MKMDFNHVILEVAFLAEALGTSGNLAIKGLLSSVDPEVIQKVVPALELFSLT